MSRLTKKLQTLEQQMLYGRSYTHNQNCSEEKIYNKLGKLEDLEEQLYNVPLEFILKHEHKQVYWNNAYHDVRNIVPYEEYTEPYVEIFVRENNKVVVKTLWFKNYGKTWWLKSERED